MPKPNKKRWGDYLNAGKKIEGTQFIAFKCPLDQGDEIKENDKRWNVMSLLETIPNLGLVISLLRPDKCSYDPKEIIDKGIDFLRLGILGKGRIPPDYIIKRFMNAVQSFIENPDNKDKLIGIHCKKGLNRTGFMICLYMIDKMGIDPNEAIKIFEEARGHTIERRVYTEYLKYKQVKTNVVENWRSDEFRSINKNFEKKIKQYGFPCLNQKGAEIFGNDSHQTDRIFNKPNNGNIVNEENISVRNEFKRKTWSTENKHYNNNLCNEDYVEKKNDINNSNKNYVRKPKVVENWRSEEFRSINRNFKEKSKRYGFSCLNQKGAEIFSNNSGKSNNDNENNSYKKRNVYKNNKNGNIGVTKSSYSDKSLRNEDNIEIKKDIDVDLMKKSKDIINSCSKEIKNLPNENKIEKFSSFVETDEKVKSNNSIKVDSNTECNDENNKN